jgi:2-polyprenyl-3-methyl-5-hydroxy-6-metoxy-1,4-benzoquinol methylase
MRYRFEKIDRCDMCGDETGSHRVLGQRLNGQTGMKPKTKKGISVSVVRCGNCGLIYSDPMPVPFDLQDHYGVPPESYWEAQYFEHDPGYFLNQIETFKRLSYAPSAIRVLDIGAGIGKGMNSLQNAGFDTYGIEPSTAFYERAVSQMKIDPDKIKLGMVEEVDYENNFFDFITFGAVLEHLYHPASSIEKTLQWLKPSGLIHIEVPSSEYLISKVINTYYKILGTNYVTHLSPMHQPFHLYEFSLKCFETLGKKLGFTIVHKEFEVCTIHSLPKASHPFLKSIMKKTNMGMQLTVWLRKN